MDEFARQTPDDRRAFIEESANRRDLTSVIIEKDFWVCWTLRRLTTSPELEGHVTFKGGTSLSKAYGISQLAHSRLQPTDASTSAPAGSRRLGSPVGMAGKSVRRAKAAFSNG